MYTIWANAGLLLGAAILAGVAYFFVLVLGKFLFEELIGGAIGRLRRRIKRKIEKDHYVY